MCVSHAPVAQLDRVSGYEPEGRGFESLPAYQKYRGNFCYFGIFIYWVVGIRTREGFCVKKAARWAVNKYTLFNAI